MSSEEFYYRAVLSDDSRFDGWVYIGVTSTGIYCRPTCPATTPKRANMRFFRTSAAAQAAGFRACKRCRPDAAPGSPEWNVRADTAGRAMRLIADGLVDRDGVGGLAARVNYSHRHLNRLLVAEVGAGPLALARAQRARTAQMLLETTDLPVSEVAFAAGFGSIRQFNDTLRAVFALTPTQLRRRGSAHGTLRRDDHGGVALRLPFRLPHDLAGLLRYLGERAVRGVEEYDGRTYRRALALPHGSAVIAVTEHGAGPGRPGTGPKTPGFVRCEMHLQDLRDLTAAVQRCRWLLDLDADPRAVDEHLAADPLLAPLVTRAPGRRVPGCVDPEELAIRSVLDSLLPLSQARAAAASLVTRHGKPLSLPVGGITHAFPTAASLAAADPADLPIPAVSQRAVAALATALANGELALDAGADRDEAAQQLAAVREIKPVAVARIRMRALRDPDVFSTEIAGLEEGRAESWRPWRSYALQHLDAVAPAR